MYCWQTFWRLWKKNSSSWNGTDSGTVIWRIDFNFWSLNHTSFIQDLISFTSIAVNVPLFLVIQRKRTLQYLCSRIRAKPKKFCLWWKISPISPLNEKKEEIFFFITSNMFTQDFFILFYFCLTFLYMYSQGSNFKMDQIKTSNHPYRYVLENQLLKTIKKQHVEWLY